MSDGASAAAALEKYAAAMQQKTGIIPLMPTSTAYQSENTSVPGETLETKSESADTLFSEEMLAQLDAAFARMQPPLVLRLYLDETSASQELRLYMETLVTCTERLSLVQANDSEEEPFRPCVRIFHADGTTPTGLAFHGVPGGHEFTSFVLGLLHAAGAGKPLEPQEQIAIERLSKSNQLQIYVTLSCTLCPELVASAQRLAAESPLVTAEVYELSRFPALRDKYQIMSVPCLVVDGGKPFFGKKNLRQLLEILTVKT